MSDKIKVVELFAGVGGFRLGLEGPPEKKSSKFEVVWGNQWEPGAKTQYAYDIYRKHWIEEYFGNSDINLVPTTAIPNHDLLVGGFPCQDYSVASTLKLSGGLKGKKGVLWWNIEKILREKQESKAPVKYLMLENVDRLLKSPVIQRGRDFAVMLKSLQDLGYAVEWRVINAADYGMPQRRRRIFFLGYHRSSPIYQRLEKSHEQIEDWLLNKSLITKAFPIQPQLAGPTTVLVKGDVVKVTNSFNKNDSRKESPFKNAGFFINGKAFTARITPRYFGTKMTLGDKLVPIGTHIPDEFYVDASIVEDAEKGWTYHKGPKKIKRKDKTTGHEYYFAEGGMSVTDPLDKPSRTIITSEGGATPSRTKHLIEWDGRYRRLLPEELEQLNMFPAKWTEVGKKKVGEGEYRDYTILPTKRAFIMGNALVIGIVEKLGKQLFKEHNK